MKNVVLMLAVLLSACDGRQYYKQTPPSRENQSARASIFGDCVKSGGYTSDCTNAAMRLAP